MRDDENSKSFQNQRSICSALNDGNEGEERGRGGGGEGKKRNRKDIQGGTSRRVKRDKEKRNSYVRSAFHQPFYI